MVLAGCASTSGTGLREASDGPAQKTPAPFTQHRFTSADGTSLSYFRHGHGPALVWVCGTLSTWNDWRDVASRLSPRFTNFVLERRGRGASADGAAYALEREVEDVLALMQEAGPGASLFGHSLGGILALEAAVQRPPARLVLYEPPFPISRRIAREAVDLVRTTWKREGPDAALVAAQHHIFRMLTPELLEAFRQTPQWAKQLGMMETFLREIGAVADLPMGVERFRTMKTSTLVLLGDQSPHVLLAEPAQALTKVLPHASLRVLPGQGHVAHVSAPVLLAREVEGFISAR
ncbi:alpha/beta hydrolase fold protein [Corallococcus coralloides DSM 2259]|uniref:Alpha/beta hydrolase fold protein n=1 Tax=Corallococcus coralloides (strain ATCC 25202 / DSM 2259 / NBRC 100086 / M2) TaxID=1144275 RepID=H8MXK9_CORCM|nr:alpha/beta hydrolase [Corallococcus coralloides]AFE06364.1 alpha/beta hydrolase fold protein [Corallococcus coralloides DSM 2259]